MVAEIVVVVALVIIGGLVVIAAGGGADWGVAALALPVGTACFGVVGLLTVAAPLRVRPVWALALTLGFAIFLVVRLKDNMKVQRGGWSLGIAVVVVIGVTVAVGDSGLVNLTPDSYRYMLIGSKLTEGSITSVSPHDLAARALIIPLVHSLARLGERFYLHSFGPLMALSTLGTLAWIACRGLAGVDRRWRIGAVLAGVVLLATNNRFVFNAFYVNGHMIFAVWLMVFVSIPWLVATGRARERLGTISMVVGPALAILRPESALLAIAVLIPMLSTAALSPRLRAGLLGFVGASTAIWYTIGLVSYFSRDGLVELVPAIMLGIGLLAVLASIIVLRTGLVLPKSFPVVATVLIIVAFAGFAFYQPDVFVASWAATMENLILGAGRWGLSVVALVTIVTVVYSLRRINHMSLLVFPVVISIPFTFILAHVREGAYRVGPGDSLNRMLLHWVPLVILSLVLMVDSRPRFGRPSNAELAVTGS